MLEKLFHLKNKAGLQMLENELAKISQENTTKAQYFLKLIIVGLKFHI